jgi:hypothetical protein
MSILEYNIGKVNNKQVMVTMNKSMNAKLQKMMMSKSMRWKKLTNESKLANKLEFCSIMGDGDKWNWK